GFARSEMSDDAFRKECSDAIAKFARSKPFKPEVWAKVEKATYYIAGADYGDAAAHQKLAAKLREMDQKHATGGNRLFYLSTPPTAFEPIITGLGSNKAAYKSQDGSGWERIIIEKPFGRDLKSAKALNNLLHKYFDESQVFRIDHYLGKETVQNLMV